MKILAIGAGNWGRNIVTNLYQLNSLCGICDPSQENLKYFNQSLQEIKKYHDYKSLDLDSLDAVTIATPVPTHFEIAKYFLERKKDVFVEKPMTLSSLEARELVELAWMNNSILMVGHLLMYMPGVQIVKKLLEAGRIGKLYSLHQVRKKLGRARYAENATWSLGVHDIAVLIALVGSVPLNIFASGHCGLQHNVEDDVYVHMKFHGGIKAHLHNSWLWPENERKLSIIGSNGMIVYDEVSSKVTVHNKYIDSSLNNVDQGVEEILVPDVPPLKEELSHFIHCCKTRTQPLTCGQSGLKVVETLERILMI